MSFVIRCINTKMIKLRSIMEKSLVDLRETTTTVEANENNTSIIYGAFTLSDTETDTKTEINTETNKYAFQWDVYRPLAHISQHALLPDVNRILDTCF